MVPNRDRTVGRYGCLRPERDRVVGARRDRPVLADDYVAVRARAAAADGCPVAADEIAVAVNGAEVAGDLIVAAGDGIAIAGDLVVRTDDDVRIAGDEIVRAGHLMADAQDGIVLATGDGDSVAKDAVIAICAGVVGRANGDIVAASGCRVGADRGRSGARRHGVVAAGGAVRIATITGAGVVAGDVCDHAADRMRMVAVGGRQQTAEVDGDVDVDDWDVDVERKRHVMIVRTVNRGLHIADCRIDARYTGDGPRRRRQN